MKTILVPTDFSENAQSAINFAIEVAKIENAKILLLHAVHYTLLPDSVPDQFMMRDVEAVERRSYEVLKLISINVEEKSKIKCYHMCEYGLAANVVLNTIDILKIDLVIMGAKGLNNAKGIIIGGQTRTVIDQGKCPIIVVPEGFLYNGINKITHVNEVVADDKKALNKLERAVKQKSIDLIAMSTRKQNSLFDKFFWKNITYKKDYHSVPLIVFKN